MNLTLGFSGPVGTAVIGTVGVISLTAGGYLTLAGLDIVPINPFDLFDSKDKEPCM